MPLLTKSQDFKPERARLLKIGTDANVKMAEETRRLLKRFTELSD